MGPVKEYTNVTFDEIQIGRSAEITVTLTQNQATDVANAILDGIDASEGLTMHNLLDYETSARRNVDEKLYSRGYRRCGGRSL